MNAHDATVEIISESGLGIRQLNRAGGNVERIIYHDGTPRTDTLARIADACGYDLLLRRRDDLYEILIDPYDD